MFRSRALLATRIRSILPCHVQQSCIPSYSTMISKGRNLGDSKQESTINRFKTAFTTEKRGTLIRIPSELVPENTSKFDLNGLNKGSIVTQSSLEVISAVMEQVKKRDSQKKLLLAGDTGIGKSTTMLQTVAYFQAEGWMVVYVPSAHAFVDGKHPFQPIADSPLFELPELTQNYLSYLLSLNQKHFKKVMVNVASLGLTKDEMNLEQLCQVGIKEANKASLVLETVLKALVDPQVERQTPVLFAIDQVNALYTLSLYHDKESNRLDTDRLKPAKLFMELLQVNHVPNAVFLTALDSSSVVRKGAFTDFCETIQATIPSSARPPLQPSEFYQFQQRDTINVLLPSELSKSSTDSFSIKTHLFPTHMAKFQVPPYDKRELKTAVDIADAFIAKDTSVSKLYELMAITGGNPAEVKKYYAITLE